MADYSGELEDLTTSLGATVGNIEVFAKEVMDEQAMAELRMAERGFYRAIDNILKFAMARHDAVMSDRADVRCHCTGCGWEFTVHSVPQTEEYKGAKWSCPHCGDEVKGEVERG